MDQAEEIDYLRALLMGMVIQHCRESKLKPNGKEEDHEYLTSGFLSSNADPMLYLAEHGFLKLMGEPFGRAVFAEIPEWPWMFMGKLKPLPSQATVHSDEAQSSGD